MTSAIESASYTMSINDRARAARVGQHRPSSSANIAGYKGAIGAIAIRGAGRGIAVSLTNSMPPVGRAVAVSRVGKVDGVPS